MTISINRGLLRDIENIEDIKLRLYNEACGGDIFKKNIQNVTDTLKRHVTTEEMYQIILHKAKYYYEQNEIDNYFSTCDYIFTIEPLRNIYFSEN